MSRPWAGQPSPSATEDITSEFLDGRQSRMTTTISRYLMSPPQRRSRSGLHRVMTGSG